jgi:hypothetical protein
MVRTDCLRPSTDASTHPDSRNSHPQEGSGVVVLGAEPWQAEVGGRVLMRARLSDRHAAQVRHRRRATRRVRVARV